MKRGPGSRRKLDSVQTPSLAVIVAHEAYETSFTRRYIPRNKRKAVLVDLSSLKPLGDDAIFILRAFWATSAEAMIPNARRSVVERWATACHALNLPVLPTTDQAFVTLPLFASGLALHGGAQWLTPEQQKLKRSAMMIRPNRRSSLLVAVQTTASIVTQAWLLKEGPSGANYTNWILHARAIRSSAASISRPTPNTHRKGLDDKTFEALLRVSGREVSDAIKNYDPSRLPTGQDLMPFLVQIAAITGANSDSLFAFRRDCMAEKPALFRQTHDQIKWLKFRGLPGVKTMLSPKVVRDGVSLPTLIEFVLKMTEPLIDLVSKECRDDLWLYARPLSTEDPHDGFLYQRLIQALLRIANGSVRLPQHKSIPVRAVARRLGCCIATATRNFGGSLRTLEQRLKDQTQPELMLWLDDEIARASQASAAPTINRQASNQNRYSYVAFLRAVNYILSIPPRSAWSNRFIASEARCNATYVGVKFKALIQGARNLYYSESPDAATKWLQQQSVQPDIKWANLRYHSLASGSACPINDILRRWCAAKGLPVFNISALRPSSATALVRSGKSIHQVQHFLHHASPTTTTAYISREIMHPTFRSVMSQTNQLISAQGKPTVIPKPRNTGALLVAADAQERLIFATGANDRGSSACRNPLDSPRADEKGKLCRSFEACYFCANAIWFREHLPLEIAKLRRFKSLKGNEPFWDLKYGRICQVIERDIVAQFSADDIAWAEALATQARGFPQLVADGRVV